MEKKLVGIKGWLLVFLVLVGLNGGYILMGGLNLWMLLDQLKSSLPEGVYGLFFLLVLAMFAPGITAGVAIYYAINHDARFFKWIAGFFISMLIFAGVANALPLWEKGAEMLSQAVTFSIIWVPYLAKSRRVRQTFGRNFLESFSGKSELEAA